MTEKGIMFNQLKRCADKKELIEILEKLDKKSLVIISSECLLGFRELQNCLKCLK